MRRSFTGRMPSRVALAWPPPGGAYRGKTMIITPAAPRAAPAKHRLEAVDMWRGLVLALMVLDHVRDFFHGQALAGDPTDPATTTPELFATRWITHLCATTFLFLAGVSIDLQRQQGKPLPRLSRFLLARGLWLVALELTVVSFGFNFGPPYLFVQVIYAIGLSMVAMAVLVRFSPGSVLAIGAVLVLGYLLAVLAMLHSASPWVVALRTFTVLPGPLPGGLPGVVMYPFVPWLGVMCLGYGLGGLFRLPMPQRRRRAAFLGLALLAAFVLLRLANAFGDPFPWTLQADGLRTVLAFLDVTKYPPSPDYVLATLGLSLLLFCALETLRGPLARVLLVFGRTSLFTYVVHIYVAHGLQLLVGVATGYPAALFLDYTHMGVRAVLGHAAVPVVQAGWGYSLPGVYGFWLLVLALVYPLSRWFAEVKRRRRDWWLSYL
jgi:uncharacterized membrane protein